MWLVRAFQGAACDSVWEKREVFFFCNTFFPAMYHVKNIFFFQFLRAIWVSIQPTNLINQIQSDPPHNIWFFLGLSFET